MKTTVSGYANEFLKYTADIITASSSNQYGLTSLTIIFVSLVGLFVLNGKKTIIQIPFCIFLVLIIVLSSWYSTYIYSNKLLASSFEHVTSITHEDVKEFTFEFPVKRAWVEIVSNFDNAKDIRIQGLNDDDEKITVVAQLEGGGDGGKGIIEYRVWASSF